MEAADVVVMNDDLQRIAETIRLSRRTHAVLWQNISLALGIKAAFLVLAVFGNASMWMAVFADMGASLLVVFNGPNCDFEHPALRALINERQWLALSEHDRIGAAYAFVRAAAAHTAWCVADRWSRRGIRACTPGSHHCAHAGRGKEVA
jgi:hypothetical protein